MNSNKKMSTGIVWYVSYIVYHSLGHVFSFLPVSNTTRNQRGRRTTLDLNGWEMLPYPHPLLTFSYCGSNTLCKSMSNLGDYRQKDEIFILHTLAFFHIPNI